jgi:hypothetical protein
VADKNLASVVMDNADQAVSISKNIENGESTHLICTLQRSPHVVEPVPICLLSDLGPGTKGLFKFGIDPTPNRADL